MTECQQNRVNELNECILNHVDDVQIWLKSCELRISSEFGCGVFATRDIGPNELLFGDRPLIHGPTGNKNEPVVCVMCYEKISANNLNSFMCADKCGLILCGQSKCAEQHKTECLLLQKWKPKNPAELSFTKIKALFVIRSLFLDEKQRKFLDLMQKNYISLKTEIYFDDEFEQFPQSSETVDYLRATSAAINTNAFKVLYREHCSGDVSLRSFYPIMSLINHKCTPNTRHDIDSNCVNRVFASRSIKKDEQIFISYSQLLWGTILRRMHLMMSKQFLCTCDRCIDPTERSTHLSAIRCQDRACSGLVCPIEPVNFKSDAKCISCERICENKRFLQIQEMATSMSRGFSNNNRNLTELKHFLEMRLNKLVPNCNQFVIEAKLTAIWKCEPITVDDLLTIKGFCEEILRTLDKLDGGESSLKGLLAHKLCVVRKKLKDSPDSVIDKSFLQIAGNQDVERFLNDDVRLRETAQTILVNTSAAPIDLADL